MLSPRWKLYSKSRWLSSVIRVFTRPQSLIMLFTVFRLGYRWVEEDEIGKAIIYASTNVFCNPKHMDPLPTHEEMSTLHTSQMPFTQNLGSLASMPAFMPQPRLQKGNSFDLPQIIEDGDDDDDIWMLPSKKTGTFKSKAMPPAPPAPIKTSSGKPPKKKVCETAFDTQQHRFNIYLIQSRLSL